MRYFHGFVKVDNNQSVRVALRVDYNRCWIGTEAIILGELGQVSQHRQGRGRPCGGSLPHYGDQYRCDVPNAGSLARLFEDLSVQLGIVTRIPRYTPQTGKQMNLFSAPAICMPRPELQPMTV